MREYIAIIEHSVDNLTFPYVAYIVPREFAHSNIDERRKVAVSLIFQGSNKDVLRDEVVRYFLERHYLFKIEGRTASFVPDDTLLELSTSGLYIEIARRKN